MSTSDRLLIAVLSRAAKGGLISVADAAKAIDVDRNKASKKLAALAERGWLIRAKRGLYLILPLEAKPGQPTVAEDPWVVAREAFPPCYIGGWSATEHWGLTEQIFRSTLVVSAANVRNHSTEVLGHEYRIFRVPRSRISGELVRVWRGSEQVLVSSRERTIVDCLRNPKLSGGIRHLVQIMAEYGDSPEHDFKGLIAAAKETATGAAWKRLGYLAEILWPKEKGLLREAKRNLTTGYARLDTNIKKKGRLIRKWRLWINVTIDA